MFYSKLFACYLVFMAVYAQEHLTCLRTDDLLYPSTSPPPVSSERLQRGKQGPKGEKGSPGVVENSTINFFRDEFNQEISQLRQQILTLQSNVSKVETLVRSFTDVAVGSAKTTAMPTFESSGWFTASNGFKYKKSSSGGEPWEESRRLCQRWRADLIVHGVRNTAVRNEIHRGLSLTTNVWYWIGLSDRETEGTFRWVNGREVLSTTKRFWASGQPGSDDCCWALFESSHPKVYAATCTREGYPGICEKRA